MDADSRAMVIEMRSVMSPRSIAAAEIDLWRRTGKAPNRKVSYFTLMRGFHMLLNAAEEAIEEDGYGGIQRLRSVVKKVRDMQDLIDFTIE